MARGMVGETWDVVLGAAGGRLKINGRVDIVPNRTIDETDLEANFSSSSRIQFTVLIPFNIIVFLFISNLAKLPS